MTIVPVLGDLDGITPDRFTDITDLPFTIDPDHEVYGSSLHFDGDLTAEQQRAVAERALETPDQTKFKLRVRQAYAGLTQIEESTGTLSAAQLSNAVRLEAKVLKALAKQVLNDSDSDE